jgi:hypothetical protein
VSRVISHHRLLAVGVGLAMLVATATPVAAGVLNASWTMPTTNADGSALTDLASFRVYYGTSSSPCPGPSFIAVTAPTSAPGPNQTATAMLTGLTIGASYFAAVTALDSSGAESACSALGSAVARTDLSVTPAGTVAFGNVNIGTTADQTLTVQNTGGGTVSGTVTTSTPFSVVSGGSFNLVGAGATATATVRFTPTVAAVTTSSVTFTTNDGSMSRTVTGTGVLGSNPPPPVSTGSNPAPTTTSVSPTSATVGGPVFTLTVNGTGFVSGSVVQWNGANRTTTFRSATQLTAAIAASYVATPGSASVTVVNPAPGGGISNAQTFAIVSSVSSTTVTFDNPVPPGSSGNFLNGLFQGINFGSGGWRWEGPYGPDTTNNIYFASSTGLSRQFSFSAGPRLLVSVRVFTGVAGTLTLTDNLGQKRTQTITPGSMQMLTTGWTQASSTVTVRFSAGWELGVDDIVYRNP